jgi:hypothetical protein
MPLADSYRISTPISQRLADLNAANIDTTDRVDMEIKLCELMVALSRSMV